MVKIPGLVDRFQNEDKGTLCAKPDLAAAIGAETEARGQAITEAVASEKEERERAIASEKEEREQAITEAVASEKEEREQAIASEKGEREQAITEAVTEAVGESGGNLAALVEAAQSTADTALSNAAGAAQDAANAQHAADLAQDAADEKVGADYVDSAVAQARLSSQKWLPPVWTKADLPGPETLGAAVTYLCRVIKDTGAPANNGVWQLVAGEAEWTYFSDNLDFIDETELAAAIDGAIGAEAEAREQADAAALQTAEDIRALPTSLQTTDPPSFAVARVAVADGGEGYAAGDALVLSDPPVAVTVVAVDENGAITAASFNADTVYASDPKGAGIAAGGGSGTGAVFEIRTAYAPGDAQADGELRYVPYSDPLVQTSRMRGYVRDTLSGSGLAQQVARLEAMRKWSPTYLYAEGDATYYNGKWYEVAGAASIGEPPGSNPEKWAPVQGGNTDDALEILAAARRVELMWNEMFGNGIVFAYHFDLDFYTLDGAVLEEGVWRADLGRAEV